jgi:hypothetical protein
MSDERKKILNMVAEGKLTVQEADRLLSALKESDGRSKFFRVRVFDDRDRHKPKVKVDIPVTVLKLVSRIGAAFKGVVPEGFKVNIHGKEVSLDEFTPEMIDKIVDGLDTGTRFTIAEVTDTENNEFVEVYIE